MVKVVSKIKKVLLIIVFCAVLALGASTACYTGIEAHAAQPASGSLTPQQTQSAWPVHSVQPLAVDVLLQYPQLPNGCEATSITMLLQYAGYMVDKTEIAVLIPSTPLTTVRGILYGGDPQTSYTGDIFGAGFYCYAQPAAQAANTYLALRGSALQAVDITGVTDAQLFAYVADGVPVAVWVTLDYTKPRYCSYSWQVEQTRKLIDAYANLHCVVLVGYTQDTVTLADLLQGMRTVNIEVFLTCFAQMGRRAVVVL